MNISRLAFAVLVAAPLMLADGRGRGPTTSPGGFRGASQAAGTQRQHERPEQAGKREHSKREQAARNEHAHRTEQGSREHRALDNPRFAQRLQTLLPAGTDVHTASAGFKNFGQFVAAAHVSKNLDIPFDQLKLKMTGPDAKSLGSAIQELRPELPESKIKTEVKTARQRAEREVKEAGAREVNEAGEKKTDR